MAPAFVNEVSGDQGVATSIALPYTPGADVRLVVATLCVTGSILGVTITYGGIPMTFLDSSVSGTPQVYMFYLPDPPAVGVTVTAAWTTSRINSLGIRGYKDVDSVSPFGTVGKAAGTSTNATVNVTSNPTELVIDAAVAVGANLTVGAGQTPEYSTASNINSGGSREPGAAAVTMNWTAAASVPWAIIAVPLKPRSDFFLMF